MTFKSILFADDAHRADDGPHTAPEFFADVNLDQVVAAFSVEHIDPGTGAGWTVHVQGVLHNPAQPARPEGCPAGKGLIVRLEAAAVKGWQVLLCPLTRTERWPALN